LRSSNSSGYGGEKRERNAEKKKKKHEKGEAEGRVALESGSEEGKKASIVPQFLANVSSEGVKRSGLLAKGK